MSETDNDARQLYIGYPGQPDHRRRLRASWYRPTSTDGRVYKVSSTRLTTSRLKTVTTLSNLDRRRRLRIQQPQSSSTGLYTAAATVDYRPTYVVVIGNKTDWLRPRSLVLVAIVANIGDRL